MIFVQAALLAFLFASVRCQCTGQRANGDYAMSWKAYAGVVTFNVSVPTANGTWIALGFSSSGGMTNSDIAIGSIDDNAMSFVEDRWAAGRQMPTYDEQQDIRNTAMSVDDGVMRMSFTRDISTSKENDWSLSIRCMYILTAWGGTVSSYSSPATFSKHTNRGVIEDLICLQNCKDGITPTSSSSVAVMTSSSTAPRSTSDDSGGGGGFELSTEYIIIIAVLGGLVFVAGLLFVVLICVCLLTKKSNKNTASYELDQSPVTASHPAARRETMEKSPSHMVTIPLNEYQEEIVEDGANIYDTVAKDEQPEGEGFYDGYDPQPPLYDQPPMEISRVPTVDTQTKPPAQEQPREEYEHMQYDPIRHILN